MKSKINEYIKKERNEGNSFNQVHALLVSNGYSEEQAKDCILKYQKRKLKTALLSITCLGIIIVSLSYYLLANNQEHIVKAKEAYANQNYSGVISILQGKSLPKAEYNWLIGKSYFHLKNYTNAIRYIKIASVMNSSSKRYAEDLAYSYLRNNEYKDAEEAFKASIKMHPSSTIAYEGLGWTYYYMGSVDEAVKAFNKSITLNPTQSSPYGGLGLIYADLKDYEKANKYFLEENLIAPHQDNHYQLGWMYYYLGEYNRSESEFKKVLDDDRAGDAHLGLGWIALRKRDNNDSEHYFKKAVIKNTVSVRTRTGLGWSYLLSGDFENAEAYLNVLNESNALEHLGKGLLLILTGQQSKAKTHLDIALEIDPNVINHSTAWLDQNKIEMIKNTLSK